MVFESLFSLVLLGFIVVHASPMLQIRESPITLRIAVRINATGGAAAFIKADRARFETMRSQSRFHVRDASFPLVSKDAIVTYTARVAIGCPATTYTLLLDTGSSNTWVGAGKEYVVTNTSQKTLDTVSVDYGSGSFSGMEFMDNVTFGSATGSWRQSIGVASNFTGFQGVDGILGLGPKDLTVGTLLPDRNFQIPTVVDNLKLYGFISQAKIGLSFEPSTKTQSVNGELDFGGTDPYKFIQPINFVPLTSTRPANSYWGINQGITYGNKSTMILPSTSAGIVDTGTTLLYLPLEAYSRYKTATGATRDAKTGLLEISAASFAKLESLFFTIGGVTYEFTANAQIWPRFLNVAIGGSANSIYLVVVDSGEKVGSGLDFINGFVWLQRFYSVYDTDNGRVGFATTPFTRATTN